MTHTRAAAAIAAVSGALLLLGATSASATRPEIEHWTEHTEHIEQEAHEGWCPDLPYDVLFTEDAHGTFRGVMRDGVFYGASTFSAEGSWTNIENGKSFTFVRVGQEKDLTVTLHEDGTATVEILFVGPTQYYDDDGDKLYKDAGRTFSTILLDEEGAFDELLGVDARGHFDTMDRDFCADLHEVVG